jgi:hypothetical protein
LKFLAHSAALSIDENLNLVIQVAWLADNFFSSQCVFHAHVICTRVFLDSFSRIEQHVCAWNLTHAVHSKDASGSIVDHVVRTVAASLTHSRFHTIWFQIVALVAGLDAARVAQSITALNNWCGFGKFCCRSDWRYNFLTQAAGIIHVLNELLICRAHFVACQHQFVYTVDANCVVAFVLHFGFTLGASRSDRGTPNGSRGSGTRRLRRCCQWRWCRCLFSCNALTAL